MRRHYVLTIVSLIGLFVTVAALDSAGAAEARRVKKLNDAEVMALYDRVTF